jgi:pyridoxal phosphate enzyme (YggS family)
MTDLAARIHQVQARINRAASNVGLPAPKLLAVSKTRPAEVIRAAYELGLREFGENYLQEATTKQSQLEDLDIIWHFIGPIQSNKTRAIANQFDWVHSVDRLKIAERLNAQRDASIPLDICLQVNIDQAPAKAGIAPAEVLPLLQACANLPKLRVRGLMAIPDPGSTQQTSASFRALFELLHWANAELPNSPPLDTLSMGMSGDLELAIAEGSTLVRIGSDLFGPRPAKN